MSEKQTPPTPQSSIPIRTSNLVRRNPALRGPAVGAGDDAVVGAVALGEEGQETLGVPVVDVDGAVDLAGPEGAALVALLAERKLKHLLVGVVERAGVRGGDAKGTQTRDPLVEVGWAHVVQVVVGSRGCSCQAAHGGEEGDEVGGCEVHFGWRYGCGWGWG